MFLLCNNASLQDNLKFMKRDFFIFTEKKVYKNRVHPPQFVHFYAFWAYNGLRWIEVSNLLRGRLKTTLTSVFDYLPFNWHFLCYTLTKINIFGLTFSYQPSLWMTPLVISIKVLWRSCRLFFKSDTKKTNFSWSYFCRKFSNHF